MNFDLEKHAPKYLSLVRIMLGLLLLQYGLQKHFGWPGEPTQPEVFSLFWWGGLIEIAGAICLILGIFTRTAAFVLSGQLAVAYFMVHSPKSFFPVVNGGSLAVTWSWVYLLFFFAGPGEWSLDALLRRTRPTEA